MSKRLTETEKWNDAWFIELNREEKLFLLYLQDNVDNAGFFEISFRKIMFDLEYSKDEILGAIKGLSRGLIFFNEGLENGDILYLKNFLKHQKNYPLNPFNSFHSNALKIFLDKTDLIEKSVFLSKIEVKGENKKTKEKTDTNLLNYINKKKGLPSPLVKVKVNEEVEVEVEEKVKVTFGKSENLLKIDVLKSEIENEFTWRETICRNLREVIPKFSEQDFKNYLEQFFKQIENDGEDCKTLAETKKHFSRWLNIQIKKQNGNRNNSNQYGNQSSVKGSFDAIDAMYGNQ